MVNLLKVAKFGLDLVEKATDRIFGPPPKGRALSGDDSVPGESAQESETDNAGPIIQWGLKIPNGNVIWDNALYVGNPISTPEQRSVLLEALKKTALELGFPPEQFLAQYGWVRRVGVPALAWSDASFTPLIEVEEEGPGVNGHVHEPSEITDLVSVREGRSDAAE
jgi:hypothetical protein